MTAPPPSPLFRVSRAVVFATVCVSLSTLGHTATSPAAVPPWAVLAGFGGVLAVTLVLAGHERSLATILGGLVGGQFALHSLFANAAAPVAHHPAVLPGDAAHGSCLGMPLAHIAAAVVSAWWLRRGERAAWSLARRLRALADRPIRLVLALLFVEPALPPVAASSVPSAAVPPPADRVPRFPLVRRGPPCRSRALVTG
ncbi:UNVERIFIED_ORG: hypothetical protein CLV66_105150 [Actinomadura viridilutea]|uniref:hypothetical protein n=1 Tax=Actinomadura rubrobrunea TaxID=115335 RepID=UPI00082B0700|nr:hypothetical protein [Actinomadura rubrobrunea]